MRLLFVVAQCFLTGALLMAQGQPTPDGSIQARNKAVAMRVFDEIFNQGKFQVADEIYAPDFQNHGLHRSVNLKIDQDADCDLVEPPLGEYFPAHPPDKTFDSCFGRRARSSVGVISPIHSLPAFACRPSANTKRDFAAMSAGI